MPKVTYLLIQSARGKYMSPLGVCGASGKVYGHAEFDPAMGAHVFRIPPEGVRCPDGSTAVWDAVHPDKYGSIGMDRDVAENMHRSLQKWIVRVEVEPDLAVPEEQHALEVEALKARIAELEMQKDAGWRELTKDWPKEPFGVTAPLDQLPPAAESETPPVDPANPPTVPPADLNLHPKTLDKLCRDAGIEVSEPRTKVKMRDALTAYYAAAKAA